MPDPWDQRARRLLSSSRRRLAAVADSSRPEPPPAAPSVSRVEFVPRSTDGPPRVLWPTIPPRRYLGQLDPAFQQRLATQFSEITDEDCTPYHTVDLPDGSTLEGVWDLRGRESAYVGDLPIAGKRIVELGPASGGLTWWMEQQGAEVVGFDAGFDVAVDMLPWASTDLSGETMSIIPVMGATQNSWWDLKRRTGMTAKMVYGPIYEMPADLGRFDIATFGAILLHLRRPFDALAEAARITDDAIVVTEPIDRTIHDLPQAVARFNPAGERWSGQLWWSHNPAMIVEQLTVLGFPNTVVTEHEQRHQFGHDRSQEPSPAPMFTVVGRR